MLVHLSVKLQLLWVYLHNETGKSSVNLYIHFLPRTSSIWALTTLTLYLFTSTVNTGFSENANLESKHIITLKGCQFRFYARGRHILSRYMFFPSKLNQWNVLLVTREIKRIWWEISVIFFQFLFFLLCYLITQIYLEEVY